MNPVYLHIQWLASASIRTGAKKIMNTRELNLNLYRTELIVRAGDLKKTLALAVDAGRRERSLRLLRQVEYALWRLARGRYGECVKCEEHVERQVLDTAPWAIFCNGCQRTVDHLQAEARARRNALRPAA
jgi:RNA polymerase-binding transcription factor DksA